MWSPYAYALALSASVALVGDATSYGSQTKGRSTQTAVSITIGSQAIVFGGPHRFREVKAVFVNAGKTSIDVLGRKRSSDFEPAGEAVVFDDEKKEWTPGRPTLSAAEIADDAPDRFTVRPGKSLEFTRTLNPSFGGRQIRIEAYYVVDKAGLPVRVTSDAFTLR
jgi:hypothetical protein